MRHSFRREGLCRGHGVMVVMEDVTEEEEVVDKVTKMAAELIFSVAPI